MMGAVDRAHIEEMLRAGRDSWQRRRGGVRKTGGRWVMMRICAGILIGAARFRSKAQARRWGGDWLRSMQGVPHCRVLLRRYHADRWRRMSPWEVAMRTNPLIDDLFTLMTIHAQMEHP